MKIIGLEIYYVVRYCVFFNFFYTLFIYFKAANTLQHFFELPSIPCMFVRVAVVSWRTLLKLRCSASAPSVAMNFGLSMSESWCVWPVRMKKEE